MMTMMSGAQNENAAGATVNEGPDRLQATALMLGQVNWIECQ